jgi:hypothetical protein
VDLLYVKKQALGKPRSYRTRIRVDTDFPLGGLIRGTVVILADVGTFLKEAKEIPAATE